MRGIKDTSIVWRPLKDTIVLISNQNKNDFVKVTVKDVKVYNGWQGALEKNWQEDFKNVSYEISNLFNWFGKKSISTYTHALTKRELCSYGNEQAKTTMLTKLNSYNELPKFARNTDEHFNNIIARYSQNSNGKIDNELLREVYDDNVDVLLSDDKLILRKAEELYIRDRVLTSAKLLAYFETAYPQNVEYKMLAVKLKNLKDIELNSGFFDSLREDYGGANFDKWFKNKVLQNEQAYVFEDSSGLKGFLYLKCENEDENYSDISPVLIPKKRLKIGTFKIERPGFRLGGTFS